MKIKIHFLILLIISALSINCSQFSKKHFYKKPKPKTTYESVETTQNLNEEEKQKTYNAAKALVEQGLEDYKKKDYEAAEWSFEEAININPSYGPAYYWLARIQYKIGSKQASLNNLKRARENLRHNKLWILRINEFEGHIQNKITTSENDSE